MRFLSLLKVAAAFGAIALIAGCPGKECKVDDDCELNQTCNDDNECVDRADLCADVTCPGGQTCDTATGECGGTCCTAGTCPDPRTACNETRCAAGEGSAACEQKTCGPGDNLGCPADFVCNQIADPPVCEAACLTERCTETNAHCDAASGQCIIRLPLAGEVGSPCTVNSECDQTSGLQCFDEATYGISGGYCSKQCTTSSECPSGSFCEGGICWDGCENAFGDCLPNNQCLSIDGEEGDRCFPIFTESQCAGGCLPNGSPCDTAVADQCEAGSSCVDFGSGNVCMKLSCHVGTDPVTGNVKACDAGQSCFGLGIGLTGCFNDCDPRDPAACSSLTDGTTTLTCSPSPQVDGPGDSYFISDDVAKCAGTAMPDSATVDIGGETVVICHDACTADTDCNDGQFCDTTEVAFLSGDVVTFDVCMNYNVVEGNCAATACGTNDCVDLNITQGEAAVCYQGCATDADCTDGFNGGCARLEFLTGDSVNICLYETEGAICFFGCGDNSDCGYCQVDSDCPVTEVAQGVTRQELCDTATNTCVMPLQGVAEVNQFCGGGQGFDSDAITVAGGTTRAGCNVLCVDDLDCGAGVACVADADANAPNTGFCEGRTALCNGPTGQCEETCGSAATGAADCLHGTCQEADGPAGENRCVLGCAADADCGPGVCWTAALGGDDYCVASIPPRMFNLDLSGSGYSPHDGQDLQVAVLDASSNVIALEAIVQSGDTISFSWQGLLTEGESYTVQWWADLNGDDDCTQADDHAWTETVNAVSADVAINRNHAAPFDADVCAAFASTVGLYELDVTGTFGGRNGLVFYIAVVETDGAGNAVATLDTQSTGLAGGGGANIAFSWVNVLEDGKTYWVDHYVDTVVDATCVDADDEVWRAEFTVAGADVAVVLDDTAAETAAACGSF